jgi:aspartate carbamoyltransferase regulatory subunit
MSYYEGSMMGSGIYSVDVSYGEFTCGNEECGKHNEAGETPTDDWGSYEVVCEFCETQHYESSVSQDKDDYYADYSEDR